MRDIESPLRLPISNVFKGQGSGSGVTGRICGGIVQVGERLRVLPGDETTIVRCKAETYITAFSNTTLAIDLDERSVSWAAAGSNATLYLTTIDPIHLNIGSVLCPLNDPVPLAACFSARIIVFDAQLPITNGASVCATRCALQDVDGKRTCQVELFHHSRDVPATISKLVASLDRATGSVTRKNPRYGLSLDVSVSKLSVALAS